MNKYLNCLFGGIIIVTTCIALAILCRKRNSTQNNIQKGQANGIQRATPQNKTTNSQNAPNALNNQNTAFTEQNTSKNISAKQARSNYTTIDSPMLDIHRPITFEDIQKAIASNGSHSINRQYGNTHSEETSEKECIKELSPEHIYTIIHSKDPYTYSLINTLIPNISVFVDPKNLSAYDDANKLIVHCINNMSDILYKSGYYFPWRFYSPLETLNSSLRDAGVSISSEFIISSLSRKDLFDITIDLEKFIKEDYSYGNISQQVIYDDLLELYNASRTALRAGIADAKGNKEQLKPTFNFYYMNVLLSRYLQLWNNIAVAREIVVYAAEVEIYFRRKDIFNCG
ncbi:hypothetical protein NEOKW01_1015 [Nematocida sp. AWRm80]|nr:hypothetical protein NEOKW01_1015 [Nematocida sp. AWRm80]